MYSPLLDKGLPERGRARGVHRSALDAALEMGLRIHPCATEPCDEPEGTSALAIIAWVTENEDPVEGARQESEGFVVRGVSSER